MIAVAGEHAPNLLRDLRAAGVPAVEIGEVLERTRPLIAIAALNSPGNRHVAPPSRCLSGVVSPAAAGARLVLSEVEGCPRDSRQDAGAT